MAIMATGMHDIRIFAGIGKAGRLLDRQGINIRPDADPPLAIAALQCGDNTGPGDAGGNGISPGGQLRCDQLAGAPLLKGKLGILMQVVAKRDDLVERGGNAALHGIIP